MVARPPVFGLLPGPDLEGDFLVAVVDEWAWGRIHWIAFLPEVVDVEGVGGTVRVLKSGIRNRCLAEALSRDNAPRGRRCRIRDCWNRHPETIPPFFHLYSETLEKQIPGGLDGCCFTVTGKSAGANKQVVVIAFIALCEVC